MAANMDLQLQEQEMLLQELQAEVAKEQQDPELEKALELERITSQSNIAEDMSKDERTRLAQKLIEQIEQDDDSRRQWKDNNQTYLKLAVQVAEDKAFPWPQASNVKYPLLTTACMQFQSRCYKALINGSRLVRHRVVGNDRLGMKAERAKRISEHMSYQLLEEMPMWEEHMDTLCMVVPICGNAFKKSYYDGATIRSELVLPQDLIVNFYATSVEEAPRKTHVMPMTMNDIVSNVRSGYYLKIDLEKLREPEGDILSEEDALLEGQGLTPPEDNTDPTVPYKVYECHCWLDLDEDDYQEPYIVTIIKELNDIVRITPRFGPKDVQLNASNEIIKITPVELFTNYRFVPDPRSGVYGLGFGHILGPINEATNTLINQIIDAGTMSNLPSGWLARGARMQGGVQAFKPGEWKIVNTMADDLRKAIIPNPVKEPSQVMFNLLGLFIQSGNELASVTDMMKGDSPGQNQPFSTTSAMLEQGMAVYSTIFKRMHRAFKRELTKIYNLNRLYLAPEVYFNIIDQETGEEQQKSVTKSDYEKDTTDVVPNSDPEQVTNYQKLADAELLFNLLQVGTINPQEATKRILEARGIEEREALLTLPPPQPNPEIEIKMAEIQIKKQEVEVNAQIDMYKAQAQAARDQAASVAKLAEVEIAKTTLGLEMAKQEFQQILEEAKLKLESQKIEADKLKAEKEERESKTIKAEDLKKKAESSKK